MPDISRISRFIPVLIVSLFVVAGNQDLRAQPAPRGAPAKAIAPEEMTQVELLESYRYMREQLRVTQSAIVNNRFEAEATARAQAAMISEKMEAMKSILETERKNRESEADRLEYDREKQRLALQQSNRSVVWIASAFGSVGLLAMLFAALFQWRAINRMADVIDQRPSGSGEYNLLPAATTSSALQLPAGSTQRLMSTIERMEQRIKELEHTATTPLPDSAANPPSRKQEVTA